MSGESQSGGGFRPGPILLDVTPFATGWEQDSRIDDGHAHAWERCLLIRTDGGGVDGVAVRWEPVVRCADCGCPRCGSSSDPDPCMERRHHDGLHITLHGRFEPVGGYLPPEAGEHPEQQT